MITKIEKFGAHWCSPCKQLDKTLDKVTNINIIKYDIDDNEELATEKNIRNVPVLIFYNENNEEVNRTVGSIPWNKIQEIIG
jgi:thiol-disulfide isomerase/thioredoxin